MTGTEPESTIEWVDKQLDGMTKAERERLMNQPAPYPWCYGWPEMGRRGKLRCRILGKCNRRPNCGD